MSRGGRKQARQQARKRARQRLVAKAKSYTAQAQSGTLYHAFRGTLPNAVYIGLYTEAERGKLIAVLTGNQPENESLNRAMSIRKEEAPWQ